MPTIYLKDSIFSKLVDSGHYRDYEKVIDRGVYLALEEEKRQIPKSDRGPLPLQPEKVDVSPTPTFTANPAPTVTEPEPVYCPSCQEPILPEQVPESRTYQGIRYHGGACLTEALHPGPGGR